MKKLVMALAVMTFMAANPLVAQDYSIVFGDLEVTETNAADIFGDGMASFNVSENTLFLRDGFEYHLSHGLVTIRTGHVFHILLEGKAEISASIECADPIIVETEKEGALKITSNISGSALKCLALTLNPDVTLNLLSRNSQREMYALDCERFTVNEANLFAEVTTADLAVHTGGMTLNGCWLQKPRGGSVNETWGGICYADGLPAKVVRVIVDGYGVEEMDELQQNVKVEKIFENGQIIVVKDGKRYDVTGRLID
jgi:hypothetical protein